MSTRNHKQEPPQEPMQKKVPEEKKEIVLDAGVSFGTQGESDNSAGLSFVPEKNPDDPQTKGQFYFENPELAIAHNLTRLTEQMFRIERVLTGIFNVQVRILKKTEQKILAPGRN